MDISGKTKDNAKARLDMKELCARKELHLHTRGNGNSYKPKAKFALSYNKEDRYVNGCVL